MPVICRLPVGGGSNKDSNIFNFPISIQTTQPTAIRSGHIWVDSIRASGITSAHIVSAITTSLPNNSLIFEVFDTRNIKMSLTQSFDIDNPTSSINISYSADMTGGNHPWLAGSGEGVSTYLAYPRVYIKTNNTIYLETAYVWDGSKWILLSQADRYLVVGCTSDSRYSSSNFQHSPIVVYNRTGASTFIKHTDIATSRKLSRAVTGVSSSNGTYFVSGWLYSNTSFALEIFKRVGDTFTLYDSFDNIDSLLPSDLQQHYQKALVHEAMSSRGSSKQILISSDGQYFIVAVTHRPTPDGERGNQYISLLFFKNTGSGFQYLDRCVLSSVPYWGGGSLAVNGIDISASNDFSVIGVSYRYYYYDSDREANYISTGRVLFGSPETGYSSVSVSGGGAAGCAVSPDGTFAIFSYKNESDDRYECKLYSLDKLQKSASFITNVVKTRPAQRGIYISPENYIYIPYFSNWRAGEKLMLAQAKYINGVYSQLGSDLYITDGAGNYQYDSTGNGVSGSSSNIFRNLLIDVAHNQIFIMNRIGIHVCSMNRDSDGQIISYTRVAHIPEPDIYIDFSTMDITPNIIV